MALLPAAIQTQQPSTCTQPIVPQVCKPSAAAARGNMPQQQQLLERTGQGSFPHIRHTLHSCFVAHSFILTIPPEKHVTDARRMRVPPPRRICRDGFQGVVQLRPRCHLEGRVHDTARRAGQDFPRAMSGMRPLHSGRGTRRVPSGILPDVGIASA